MEQTTTRQRKKYTPRPNDINYANYGMNDIAAASTLVPTVTSTGMSLDSLTPLPIEDAPVTRGRTLPEEILVLRKRIDLTVVNLPIGKAFPVPGKSKTTVRQYLNDKYPEMKFRVSDSKGAPFCRFIRVM